MPFLPSLPEDAGPPSIFARYPDMYAHWSAMSQVLMNGPSPLTSGERELLLAYAAGVGGCAFVYGAHAEVAYAWGIERGLIERLVADPDAPGADPRFRPLLKLTALLVTDSASVTEADVQRVLDAGWDEHAVHDVVAIAARAAFMQRLVHGMGFVPLSPDVARSRAQKRVELGYVDLYAGPTGDHP